MRMLRGVVAVTQNLAVPWQGLQASQQAIVTKVLWSYGAASSCRLLEVAGHAWPGLSRVYPPPPLAELVSPTNAIRRGPYVCKR